MVKFKYKNQNVAVESINIYSSNYFKSSFIYGAYKCKSNDNKMILYINNYLISFLCFLKYNLFDNKYKKISFYNIFFILFVYLLLPHKTDGLINRKYFNFFICRGDFFLFLLLNTTL